MELMVRVPGSCGELVQGRANGGDFLGTCPIDRYTTVKVSSQFSGITGLGDKSQRALKLTLQALGYEDFPYGLQLCSELPQGKGMASSSADIAAVVAAVLEALQKEWSPQFIMDIATQIEPTDGIFCPGIVLMDHINGRVLARYDRLPAIRITMFDTGGTVDTCSFHQERSAADDREAGSSALLADFRQAMELCQAELLAKAATRSAFGNQELLYKKDLGKVWQLGKEAGALGINAAHSGTVLGLLWGSGIADSELRRRAAAIARQSGVEFMELVNLRSGGVEVERL